MQASEKALKDADRAINLSPKYAPVYVVRGRIWLYQGQVERAYEDFKCAEVFEPLDCLATLLIVWIDIGRGMAQENALEHLEEVGKRSRNKRSGLLCQGMVLWLQCKYADAEWVMKEVIERAPGDWDGYFWLGMTLGTLGRDEEALGELLMPAVLFGPIRWFEERNEALYKQAVSEFLGGSL
jgi:tetratricopeptide (TPR) repeat protein